jgi:acetoin utilization protein AcuC
MFRSLRLKREPEKSRVEPGSLSGESLAQDGAFPITIYQINRLPENTKRRLYRALIPPNLLARFGIDPITWKGAEKHGLVELQAEPETGVVKIGARKEAQDPDEFFLLELSDNAFNSLDLSLLLLNDPDTPRFRTDFDEDGHPTLFGTARRNLDQEEQALRAGLAPGQTRSSLGASRLVLDHLEIFLMTLGHRSYFLEPLTYASAWIFERRGFAYVRGHRLMDEIHQEFQPGGRLHAALDGSTPFRQPEAWCTVRGRAWAIQDGILEALDTRWNGLRMVKQIGRSAGVETFPEAAY